MSFCLSAIGIAVVGQVTASLGARQADRSGQRLFSQVWQASAGAGPHANAQSCAACHATPRLGGGADTTVAVSLDETDPTGGHLFRQFLIRPGRAIVRRTLPRRVFHRRPPALFGSGLLERVPPGSLAAHVDAADRDGDGVSGRVPAGSGRFGWKARFPTVEQAIGAALVNELGLSNRIFKDDDRDVSEIGDAELSALVTFVHGLPPPRAIAADREGRAAFEAFGCATCHVPRLDGLADEHGAPVEAFTDLLLHDMGPRLADLQEGDATPSEFRTPPLWGLGESKGPYLHDGRALTIEDAIRAHNGEAHAACQRYEAAPPQRRIALHRFLGSL